MIWGPDDGGGGGKQMLRQLPAKILAVATAERYDRRTKIAENERSTHLISEVVHVPYCTLRVGYSGLPAGISLHLSAEVIIKWWRLS
jgi:hypothetical protein